VNPLNIDARKTLAKLEFGSVLEAREALALNGEINPPVIASVLEEELQLRQPDIGLLNGIGKAMVALLPGSYDALKHMLFSSAPQGVFEVHFSIFSLLEPQEFNELERDGMEWLLTEYLFQVRSTKAYAAWRAGLALGDEWLSPRSEATLRRLIESAKYPAGRMGAINGYRYLVEHRRTFSHGELAALSAASRNDRSERVLEDAKFHLKRMIKLRDGAEFT
jgi:hypothetical protein